MYYARDMDDEEETRSRRWGLLDFDKGVGCVGMVWLEIDRGVRLEGENQRC